MSVCSLGYIELEVRDFEAWIGFGTDVLGLMVANRSDSTCEFRLDDEVWRIRIVQSDKDGLSRIGLQARDQVDLATMRSALSDAGYLVRDGDEASLEDRKVTVMISCEDPDGLTVEIYCDRLLLPQAPFASPQGVSGFVAGEQGLGHVALVVADIEKSREFYADILGFKLSDQIMFDVPGAGVIAGDFFHCNARHHSLALFPVPGLPNKLLHFMIQASTIDDVGFALDRAQAAGLEITHTLGRHTNDKMLSFYMKSPSGEEVEFGYGALEIGPNWHVKRYNSTSSWGHKSPEK